MHAKDLEGHGTFLTLPKGVVHPNSDFAAAWSMAMLVSILSCLIYIPFQMAFDYTPGFGGTFSQGFWAICLPIMDLYFCADIVLNLRLAFYDDGDLITSRSRIRRRYLSGWGPIDMLALVPSLLDLIAMLGAASGGGGAVDMLRGFRMLRLARLLKLMRLLKVRCCLRLLPAAPCPPVCRTADTPLNRALSSSFRCPSLLVSPARQDDVDLGRA